MHWLRAEFAAGCGSTLWGLNRTLTDAITGTVIVRGRSRDSDETTIQRGCESEETRNSPPPSPLFLSLALCVGIYDERRAGIAQRSESQPHMRWSDKSKLVRTDRCLPDDFQCDQDEDIEIVLGVDWFCLREESPGFISPVKSDPPHGRRPMGGKHCLVQNLGGRSKISCAPEKHTPIFDGSWTRTRVSRAQSPNAGPKGKGERRETSEYNARTAVNLFLVQPEILAAVASIHVRPMKTNQRLQKRLHVNSPL